MHISDTIAALFAAIGFEERPISDGVEYSARVIGAAMAGQLAPDGARVLRFTIDASGRWLAMVDAWGKVERDCDLRCHGERPASAIEAIAGASWPAIRAAIESARGESARQSDLARNATALAKGAKRRQLDQWARQHIANALAIDAALNGAPAPISDADLFAALAGELTPIG